MGSHLYTDYIFLNEIGYFVLFVLSILRKKHLIQQQQFMCAENNTRK